MHISPGGAQVAQVADGGLRVVAAHHNLHVIEVGFEDEIKGD
jgi:hypothetical protein